MIEAPAPRSPIRTWIGVLAAKHNPRQTGAAMTEGTDRAHESEGIDAEREVGRGIVAIVTATGETEIVRGGE
jgi:hypothetical protein